MIGRYGTVSIYNIFVIIIYNYQLHNIQNMNDIVHKQAE